MKKNLHKLFVDELKGMLDAEEQITKGLSKWVRAAYSPELKKSLRRHLSESRGQANKLKHVFRALKLKPSKKPCRAIKSLLKECSEVVMDYPKSAFRDAALIAKAQRVEHFEMSAYGTLCAFAKELDLPKKIATLLHKNYEEEAGMDRSLTEIAKGNSFKRGINHEANEWAGHHKVAVGW